MCLAVPGQITEIRNDGNVKLATVAMPDGLRDINLTMLPEVQPGDWIVAHSGFAIARVTAAEAREALALLGADPPHAQLPDS